MSEPIRYEIQTLNDFIHVPEDRIDRCLEDFKQALNLARLVETISASVPHPPPLNRFVWIDDDKKKITVNLTIIKGE